MLWVDLADPTLEEGLLLAQVFHFHELAIEDALAAQHHPKIEAYETYVYMILHGIDFNASRHQFATHDTDFFIGANYLVTVHGGKTRSIPHVLSLCDKTGHIMREGPIAVMHRIVETMVGHYRPEVEKLAEHLDRIERKVFQRPDPEHMRVILSLKRDVASLRRVVQPQRDVVSRLARRELPLVNEQMGYRFRDVYDSLVRLSEESVYFQDRITGLLDAHLSSLSNRLNGVMKVLTLIATIFMPMTVLTGLFGMNMPLPQLPGGDDVQFYWVLGMLAAVTGGMYAFYRSSKWL